jgi:hypothetical protein
VAAITANPALRTTWQDEVVHARSPWASIGLREELLGDLARIRDAAAVDERERLTRELGMLDDVRAFIEAVAPGLIAEATSAERSIGDVLEVEVATGRASDV